MRQMTEEKRQRIAELWNQNMPSSKIAEEVGVTRNAVIGAVYRLRKRGEIIKSASEKRCGRHGLMQSWNTSKHIR